MENTTLLLAQSSAGQPLGGTIKGAGAIGEAVETSVGSSQGILGIFTDQLSNIITFMTILGGIFFVVYFLIAGFEWLRAGGDTGQVDKAKTRMTNAAIGLLVMILATSLVGIVGGVFGLDILNPGAAFGSIIPGGGTP